jgi:hypothetical protein
MVKENHKDCVDVALRKNVKPIFLSEGFRSRPNYLIYFLDHKINDEDKIVLETHKPSYCIYENASFCEALIGFLSELDAGVYLSDEKIRRKINESTTQNLNIALILIDPHTIEDFETKLKATRVGVLIRRNILATNDFKTILPLKEGAI